MTNLEKFIRRFDNGRSVRRDNSAQFNIRVDEFLSVYNNARASDSVTAATAGELLDRLTLVFGNITGFSNKELAVQFYPVLRAEMPAWNVVKATIASDMVTLRRAKKTKLGVSQLSARSALQIAILTGELGFFDRIFDERWASAKEHYAFASRWLKSAYEEEHQQHAEIVVYDAPRPYTPIIGTPTYGGL